MSVKIRLTRTGRHSDPFYRIVAADSRFARDGRIIEQIGVYDPKKGLEGAIIDENLRQEVACRGSHPERQHPRHVRQERPERQDR